MLRLHLLCSNLSGPAPWHPAEWDQLPADARHLNRALSASSHSLPCVCATLHMCLGLNSQNVPYRYGESFVWRASTSKIRKVEIVFKAYWLCRAVNEREERENKVYMRKKKKNLTVMMMFFGVLCKVLKECDELSSFLGFWRNVGFLLDIFLLNFKTIYSHDLVYHIFFFS